MWEVLITLFVLAFPILGVVVGSRCGNPILGLVLGFFFGPLVLCLLLYPDERADDASPPDE